MKDFAGIALIFDPRCSDLHAFDLTPAAKPPPLSHKAIHVP
jgi:hypothetical protein